MSLISREALLEAYDRAHKGPPGGARKLIAEAPEVDAEPVRHGRWIELPKALNPAETPCQCSACKHILSFYYTTYKSNFCPNYGARMDADEIAERRAAADDYAEY